MSMREVPNDPPVWQYQAPATMSTELFQQWATLLEQRTGIALPEARKTFLLTNLSTRMRELGLADYRAYYDLIMSGARGQVEWEILVDRLTVHETRFFRDHQALQFIRDEALPELVEKKAKPYTVNAWSVGCATGEEPYSLAIVLEHFFAGQREGYYYGITASDVSRTALQSARKAVFHKRRIKNIPADLAAKYLQVINADHVEVIEPLRQKVCFVQINMLQLDRHPLAKMDFIICQNVLIYFKQELRQQILLQMVEHLKPNGVLILGPGEAVGWSHPELVALKHKQITAYRRQLPSGQGD